MGSKIPSDRIYHSDKILAGIPQLLDDFSQLIDDQETGMSTEDCIFAAARCSHNGKEHKLFFNVEQRGEERRKKHIKKIIYVIIFL